MSVYKKYRLNMNTQSIDTHPEAEVALLDLLRKASFVEKFSQVRSLSRTTLQLSRRAIARVNKGLTDQEIDILFVSFNYGKDLAIRLEAYLRRKNHVQS